MLGGALRPEEVHLGPEGEYEEVVRDGRETAEPDLLGPRSIPVIGALWIVALS